MSWVYEDDAGAAQGPFETDMLLQWIRAGYMNGSRRVKRAGSDAEAWKALSEVEEFASALQQPAQQEGEEGEDGDQAQWDEQAVENAITNDPAAANAGDDVVNAPQVQNEEEARLSEYYRRYYENYYAQQAALYQQQMQQQQQLEEARKRPIAPPDDGYVLPQPKFEDYAVKGTFSKVTGRFTGVSNDAHWQQKGLSTDREGRQMQNYYDVDAFQAAMSEGKVVKNAPDKKKAKKNKEERGPVPTWMKEDPLEGAFKKE